MQQFKVPKTDWRLNIPALLADWLEKLFRFMNAMFLTDKRVQAKPKTLKIELNSTSICFLEAT